MVPPKPPDYSAGPPPGWKPGDPLPGAATTPKSSGGGGAASLAIGALAGGVGAIGSYYANKPPSPYTNIPAPYTPGAAVGSPGGPPGPPAPVAGFESNSGLVPTSGLSNWPQYGIPDQAYQGE